MRGWVSLPIRTRPLIMLGGERGRTIIGAILRILGGSIPPIRPSGGIGGGVYGGDRAMVGGGEGGRYP